MTFKLNQILPPRQGADHSKEAPHLFLLLVLFLCEDLGPAVFAVVCIYSKFLLPVAHSFMLEFCLMPLEPRDLCCYPQGHCLHPQLMDCTLETILIFIPTKPHLVLEWWWTGNTLQSTLGKCEALKEVTKKQKTHQATISPQRSIRTNGGKWHKVKQTVEKARHATCCPTPGPSATAQPPSRQQAILFSMAMINPAGSSETSEPTHIGYKRSSEFMQLLIFVLLRTTSKCQQAEWVQRNVWFLDAHSSFGGIRLLSMVFYKHAPMSLSLK